MEVIIQAVAPESISGVFANKEPVERSNRAQKLHSFFEFFIFLLCLVLKLLKVRSCAANIYQIVNKSKIKKVI